MSEAFIGLDLGTTSIKAVAFDVDDRELAQASLPTATHHLGSGGAEYDAGELWTTAAEVLRTVTDVVATGGHHVSGVATASMGEAGVLLDAAGEPTSPIIAWFDERTEPQAQWWAEHVGVERTQRICGLTPRPVFGAAKMLWTKAEAADAWSRGRHWLNMADWAAYCLTGEMATDYSLASRTMLFDLPNLGWSDELIDAAGLDRSMLAPLIQSGECVGQVTDAAATQTGLPAGIAVGAGGQDHVCAALALGVTEPGMLLDSIGTAEALFLVTDRFEIGGELAAAGISQGAHVEPGRTYAMTGLAGGGRIDARRQELGQDWDAFLATPEAEEVIAQVASGAQERIDLMLGAVDAAEVRHVATGGGTRNARLIEHKREIGGRPIEVAAQMQATALGAAHLARRAAGTS